MLPNIIVYNIFYNATTFKKNNKMNLCEFTGFKTTLIEKKTQPIFSSFLLQTVWRTKKELNQPVL